MYGEAFLSAVFGGFVFFYELRVTSTNYEKKCKVSFEACASYELYVRQTSFERHRVQQYCSTGDESFESYKLWATCM